MKKNYKNSILYLCILSSFLIINCAHFDSYLSDIENREQIQNSAHFVKQADKLFNRGMEEYLNDNYLLAAKYFAHALETYPNHSNSKFVLSEVLRLHPNIKNKMVSNEGNQYDYEIYAGKLYTQGKQFLDNSEYTNANDKFQMICDVFPESEYCDDAMYMIAKISLLKNQTDKAKKILQKIINIFPDDSLADNSSYYLAQINNSFDTDLFLKKYKNQDIIRTNEN